MAVRVIIALLALASGMGVESVYAGSAGSAGSTPAGPGAVDRAVREILMAERDARLETLATGMSSAAPHMAAPHMAAPHILLPGWGQRYLGQHRRSWMYLGAEAGIWTTVASFYLQGSMREDRYREYAAIVSGADPDVNDDQYYKDVALYPSSDVFATVIRWEARALYPEDREAQQDYYRENIYPADRAWSFPTEATFDEYKWLRRRSKHAYRTAVNVIGFSVLNRLVSAIDTVTGREREQFAGGVRPVFSMKAMPGSDSPTPYVYVGRSF